MTTTTLSTKETDLIQVLVFFAALAAFGSGLIHFKVIGDHADLAVVAGGFALMGAMQWAFAGRILTRPSPRLLGLGGLLHAGIAMLWIASRTIGIPFVDGARQPAEVGVADLAANILSVFVVGTALLGLAIYRQDFRVSVPTSIANRMKLGAAGFVVFVIVSAMFAPHTHSHSPIDLAEMTHDHESSAGS
ncbi:MAG TPA: hypothetical protein VIB78_12880 [Acidimicrobiia bacterium]|jgi:hypothetical protein